MTDFTSETSPWSANSRSRSTAFSTSFWPMSWYRKFSVTLVSLLAAGSGIAFLLLFARPALSAPVNCAADPAIQPIEADFVQLLNVYRQSQGSPPLSVSPTLSRAAQWMANDLAAHGYFSHTDSLGRSFAQRAQDCGIGGFAGENIAGGGTTAAFTLWNWQSSPGHNATMLNPNFTRIGLGFASGGVYGTTWVADFSSQGDIVNTATPSASPTPATPRSFGVCTLLAPGMYSCPNQRGWNYLNAVRVVAAARD